MLKVATHGRMAALDLRLLGRDPGEDAKLAAAANRIAAIHHANADRTYADIRRARLAAARVLRPRHPAAARAAPAPAWPAAGTSTTSSSSCSSTAACPPSGSASSTTPATTRRRASCSPPPATGAISRAARLDREDGRRHQRPSPRGRAAPPRLPVAAGRHRPARGPHPAPGQPQPRGRGDPLRLRRIASTPTSGRPSNAKPASSARSCAARLDVREIEDVGDTALSYSEVKALATGDPRILEKAKHRRRGHPPGTPGTLPRPQPAHPVRHHQQGRDRPAQARRRTPRQSTRRSPAASTPAATGSAMTVNGTRWTSRADAAIALRNALAAIGATDRTTHAAWDKPEPRRPPSPASTSSPPRAASSNRT